jgi:membrane protease YdiL (CAAX protease family)
MILNELINAFINIAIFTSIPLICWLITASKEQNFFSWIGLKKPVIKNKNKFYILCIGFVFVFAIASFIIDSSIPASVQLASQRFAGKRWSTFIPAIIFSFLKTGLAEEIFFRGFLGKRISKRFSFLIGNLVQAILFGFLHGVMLISVVGMSKAIAIIVFTGVVGWTCGYINEKLSDGSILPSWILHGIANLTSAIIDMFSLI